MTPRPVRAGAMAEYETVCNMQSISLARSEHRPKPSGWRDQLRDAFRDAGSLLAFLGLESNDPALTRFPMLVPRAFAGRMQPGDPADPLLLQVLPDRRENEQVTGFVADPVGDTDSRTATGVLHKYQGRVLLVATGACAVHCRYCFRQDFPYAGNYAGRKQWDPALEYIAAASEVEEVILSGGDPLMLPTRRLEQLTNRLAEINHVRRLRIHTRLPVVLPDRVTERLTGWLAGLPWPVVLVLHANHAREFDRQVDHALHRLRSAGVHLLNQAVLLAGVNDSSQALAELSRRGLEAGVMPYYLHLLDRVAGSARFEIDQHRACELVDTLRRELSGYLVPRLVREQAGAPYKLPIL